MAYNGLNRGYNNRPKRILRDGRAVGIMLVECFDFA